ncbi:MAG: HK97 family phage prohead protease [Clostridia bacterium]|nr:HK97 family phage prohead protease [Clostridia bacterium]
MPIKDNREYRSMAMPLASGGTNKRFDTEFYVEGYATTFDKPYLMFEYEGVKYYEVIDRHALDEADMSDVIMQYDHQGKVFARNSNNTLYLNADDTGLFTAADLSRSQAARSLHEEIDGGLITKMSWAFTVAESKYNKDTHTRTITKIKKVYDVSAVSMPANPDTSISARSYFDGVIEMEKQELLEGQKEVEIAKLKFEF